MDRNTEFQKVKETIREHIAEARCGLFFTMNTVGDCTENIYIGRIFTVEICRRHGYFEVFGCTAREERILTDYYKVIKEAEE